MITQYELSAIVGFYRMGNPPCIIAAILDLTLWEVNGVLKHYQT